VCTFNRPITLQTTAEFRHFSSKCLQTTRHTDAIFTGWLAGRSSWCQFLRALQAMLRLAHAQCLMFLGYDNLSVNNKMAESPASRTIQSLVDRIIELEPTCTERFVAVTVTETFDMVSAQQNESTKGVTASHCRLLQEWLKSRGELRDIELIEPKQLDAYFAEFFLSVRKYHDIIPLNDLRREYEPTTLIAMHGSLYRYLAARGYENIKHSDLFRHSREVLAAKMKELKTLGKGNKPNASQPFTKEDFEILLQKNLIGTGKFLI